MASSRYQATTTALRRRALQRRCWNELHRDRPDDVEVPDRIILGEVEGIPPRSALDLGCGMGTNALYLARLGWTVTGVDWSEEGLRRAESESAARGLHATFVVADMTTWLPSQRYELVTCMYALPAGQLAREALATASTALAPGGLLLVAEWDRSMAAVWNIDDDDLLAPELIRGWLPDLTIESAGVRHIEGMFGVAKDARATIDCAVNVAFVRARRPPDAIETNR